ncbi:MAG: PD-(D/E)XK nuclease family protein [Candidatus Aenigmatarchaeota archaeon]
MVLVELIDKFYIRCDRPKERNYFYISEVDKCQRAIFFSVKGVPCAAMEPRVSRILDQGDHVHMRLMSAMYGLGIITASEIKIPETELFHGRADGIANINGENYVVEMKSISPFGFKKTVDAPKVEHLKQLQLYLNYFNMQKGIILMENKGDQELKEFVVEKNDLLIKKILRDFEALREMIGRNETPKIPDRTLWEYDKCGYCPYKEHCGNVAKQGI